MAWPDNYHDAATLRAYVGGEDASAGTLMESVEEGLIDRLQEETGRWLRAEKAVVEVSKQNGRRHTIWVANPIVSLTSVQYGLSRSQLTTLTSSSVSFDGNAVTYDLAPFPAGFVEITYQAGYADQASVPQGLKQDILDLFAAAWRHRLTISGPQEDVGGAVVQIPTAVIRRWMQPAGV